MRAELLVAVLLVSLDRGFPDGAVHPFDPAVGPWVVGFREPEFHTVCHAHHVKAHLPRIAGVSVARLFGNLDAVVGQDRVDAAGNGIEKMLEELPGGAPVGLAKQLDGCEFAFRSITLERDLAAEI